MLIFFLFMYKKGLAPTLGGGAIIRGQATIPTIQVYTACIYDDFDDIKFESAHLNIPKVVATILLLLPLFLSSSKL